ncbi:MAG: DUF348 domain-containing protein [Chloroflexi bacterium]|nr:DUF348 domain-containing protein [Chloroflexota bacterium]
MWRQTDRRTFHAGRLARQVKLLPILIVIAFTAAGYAAQRWWVNQAYEVTVVINGQPTELRTHRQTVRAALRVVGVNPSDAVFVEPDINSALRDGLLITVAEQRSVVIHYRGDTLRVNTHEVELARILESAGLRLNENERAVVMRGTHPSPQDVAADPDLATVAIVPQEIAVRILSTVIVTERFVAGEERQVSFETTASTLGEAFAQAGYVLHEADRLSLPLSTGLGEGQSLQILIERATPITLTVDGLVLSVYTHQETVLGLLDEVGVELGRDDYTLPEQDTRLTSDLHVDVFRLSEAIEAEEIDIPYETIYVPDPTLELDQQRLVQAGQAGTMLREWRVRTENGQIVSELLIGERELQAPSSEVIAYGTRIVLRQIQTEDGTFEYWRKLTVLATSYSPLTAGDKQPGDPFFGVSGTGAPVLRGVIAVDPRVITLGTYMYVPGYGPGRALDVGGAIKGLRIDLGYSDEFLVQWNNWTKLYLITPVPPPDQIIYVLSELTEGPPEDD